MANKIQTKFVITDGPGKFDFLHDFTGVGSDRVTGCRFSISAQNRSEKSMCVEPLLLSPIPGYEGQEWTFVAFSNHIEQREEGEGEHILVFYSTSTRKGKLRRLTLEEEETLQSLRLI